MKKSQHLLRRRSELFEELLLDREGGARSRLRMYGYCVIFAIH